MKPHYKAVYFFSLLYFLMLVLTAIFTYKAIRLPYIGVISPAVLFFSLQYLIGDLITEVYGYKESRKIIISSFITVVIFSAISTYIGNLIFDDIPYSSIGHVEQACYQNIFSVSLPNTTSFTISYFISAFLNIKLLEKSRILLRGRFFGLRSLGASSIGALLYVILNMSFFAFFLGLPISLAIKYGLISFSAKLICFAILVYPNSLMASILKIVEKDAIKAHQENLF